jgi:nucleoside-diphosphate-sugar epimerase
MTTVVVTGVAGPLGRRVAAKLAGAPGVDRVIGLDVTPAVGFPAPVETRVVDLAGGGEAASAALEEAVAGADGLVHLAWRTAGDRRAGASTAEANHRMMRRVVDAAGRAEPPSVVHLSSATVYGAWADNPVPLSEEAALRPNLGFSFAVEKADAERLLGQLVDGHPGVAVAVLRPAATVGAAQHPLYRALGGIGGLRLGDPVRPVQFLHVDDLADAVVLAWSRRLRGVYNVAPDGGITEEHARDLAGGVARLALPGRGAPPVASWAWRLGRRGSPAAARPYHVHPWAVAPDRLKAEGWAPKYTSEEALVATDDRPHWDDLPPGRRQNYALAAAAAGLVTAAGVAAAGVAALRRRRPAGWRSFRSRARPRR